MLIKYQKESSEIKYSICYCKEVHYLFYIRYNFLMDMHKYNFIQSFRYHCTVSRSFQPPLRGK